MANFDIYSLVKSLAATPADEKFTQKAMMCCVLNGFDPEKYQEKNKFGHLGHVIMKPQYIHSACSIYMILRNPTLKQGPSFADILIEKEVTKEALILAIQVLQSDAEVWAIVLDIERSIKTYHIIDERNKTVITPSE